jgi:hypothetical protein
MKNLALWGLPASGKTKLLSQLYLRQSQFQSEWRIFPANATTQKFVERERRKMVEEREFPMPTKEEAPEEIAYEFIHTTSDRRFHLFTVDLAGERSKRLDQLEPFTAAAGMLMLLDAGRVANQATDFKSTLETFFRAARDKGHDRDERPVAVCLSKADFRIASQADLDRAEKDPEGFVAECIEKEDADLLHWVRQYCPHHKLLPVSSVGVCVRYGHVRPALFYDQRMVLRLTNDGAPLHVHTAFEWLLKELG